MDDKALIEKAVKAMERAYVPYSKFPVGAAILCKDGTVITAGDNLTRVFSHTFTPLMHN